MGKVIENPKNYTGRELEQIFFRPTLTGPSALNLGLKVMYNMPVPTTLNFWRRNIHILQKYSKGWNGGDIAKKYQKIIELQKVKSEMGYSAEDYFGMIYEIITNSPGVNLDDLKGSDIEKAETQLFREALDEVIRVEMWLGDTTRADYDGTAGTGFNSINGLIKQIKADIGTGDEEIQSFTMPSMSGVDAAEGLFKQQFRDAKEILKQFKGDLAYFVTDDVLYNYEDTLTSANLESARSAMINGVKRYFHNGIPIIPVKLGNYLPTMTDMPQSFSILTPAQNMAVAVNSKNFPGSNSEIRFWYNPDEMENRQRAIFMMGTGYLLPEVINVAFA